MSQQTGGYPGSTVAGSPSGQPSTQVARDEAAEVGRTAADAGRQVAGTAAEQAANVAQEAKAQARDLVGEVRGQVQDQARTGQQKAAEGIRALSQELRGMADNGGQSGTVTEVARQVADRADGLAGWLNDREPGDLLDEVRSFARRRPGAFLLGAAIAGVVVGRLTRGAVDAARADSGPQTASGSRYPTPYPAAAPAGYGTSGYPQPDYTQPGYAAPGYAPGHTAPGHTAPGHTAPGHTTPAYAAPGYAEPVGGSYGAPGTAPTPPRGFAETPASPHLEAPGASTLPPADPAGAADPTGRPRTVGEYVDELERAGEHTYGDERPEPPYRAGDGGLR